MQRAPPGGQAVIVLGAVGMIVVQCPVEGAHTVLVVDAWDFKPSRAGAGLQTALAARCAPNRSDQSICVTPAKDGVVVDEGGRLSCLRPAGAGASREVTPVHVPNVFLTPDGVLGRHVQLACNNLAVVLIQMPGDGVPTVCVLNWDGTTRFSGWPADFVRPRCLRMWPQSAWFAVADVDNDLLMCGFDGVMYDAMASYTHHPVLFALDTSDGGIVIATIDHHVPTLRAVIRKFLPGTNENREAWCVTGPTRECRMFGQPLLSLARPRRHGLVGLDVLPGDAGVVVCDEDGHRIWTIRPHVLRCAWLGMCALRG